MGSFLCSASLADDTAKPCRGPGVDRRVEWVTANQHAEAVIRLVALAQRLVDRRELVRPQEAPDCIGVYVRLESPSVRATEYQGAMACAAVVEHELEHLAPAAAPSSPGASRAAGGVGSPAGGSGGSAGVAHNGDVSASSVDGSSPTLQRLRRQSAPCGAPRARRNTSR